MKLPVVLRAEAAVEFDEAFDWHEAQRPGRGSAFAAAIQTALNRIAGHPLSHRVVLADIRRAVVRRFPYCIYYRPHADRVEVIAVFHTSRDPRIWQSRA